MREREKVCLCVCACARTRGALRSLARGALGGQQALDLFVLLLRALLGGRGRFEAALGVGDAALGVDLGGAQLAA